ncbi:MAG TPA: cytochrome c [Candidatus Binatia bacterium]|jgi:ubiquinol-cytochrome c reductase cytochrome c subunit
MQKLFFATVLIFVASVALAQDQAPAGSAEAGYKAYMKYQCYTCHGTIGHGADRGTGPKLAPTPVSFATFAAQVRTPRQDMPAYRKQFVSDQELADMYAYLATIKPSPPAKDLPLPNY